MATTLSEIIHEHDQHCTQLDLSETVHSLQLNLQAALDVASCLKDENVTLKKHLEDSRSSNIATQRRHSEWREAWKTEVDLVSKRERELANAEKLWNAKLMDKRREMDELEELLSKKKDGARNECDSNAQINANNSNQCMKLRHLEEEVNKWRTQYYMAQKESEKIEQAESKYLREAELSSVLRKELESLQKLYTDRVTKDDNSTTQKHKYEEKLRELTLKVEERDLVVEKLRIEEKEMRKARDDAVVKYDELLASEVMAKQKIMQECAKYEALSKTLQERLLVAEREVKESAAVMKGLEETLTSANEQIDQYKDNLETVKVEHGEELAHLRQSMARSDQELRVQLSRAQKMLADEEAKGARNEASYEEVHKRHIQSIKQLTKEFEGNNDDTKEKLLAAQDFIRQIENKLSNLEGEKAQLQHNHQTEMQRLKHACESCHNDLNLALLQKEEISKMCETMSLKASKQSTQLEELERAMLQSDEQCELLKNEKLGMQRKMEELVLENKALEERVQLVSDRMLAATKEAGVWKEKSSQVGEVVKEVRGQLLKEQRRSEAYKEKALEAHQRNVEAKKVLESLRTKGL